MEVAEPKTDMEIVPLKDDTRALFVKTYRRYRDAKEIAELKRASLREVATSLAGTSDFEIGNEGRTPVLLRPVSTPEATDG